MPQMRTAETPFLADWFAISMRWLGLLGMVIAVAVTSQFTTQELAALLLAALWNIYLALLALQNRRLPAHRVVSLALDLAVALVIFFSTGGLTGGAAWSGLLPVVTAGIYYNMKGSLAIAGLLEIALVYWSAGTMGLRGSPLLQLTVMGAGAQAGVGLLIGLLSQDASRELQRAYSARVAALTENERRGRRAEHERMQAFYQLLEVLGATLDYQVVLETAMDLSAAALSDGNDSRAADQMVRAVLLLSDNELRVGAAHRFTPADLRLSFPAARGVLRDLVQTAEIRLVPDPSSDPELARIEALRGCRSALALPLRRGLTSFGLMLFAHPDPDFFTPERREVLDAIGHQAVIAIQNARLYKDVQQEKARIVETQDEARKKLARELHDGPTQSVAAIAMGISIARRMMKSDREGAEEELERTEELARRTTQEIRHMLFTLRPLVLESEGLGAALRVMAEKMGETYQQNVVVEADPSVEELMDTGKQSVVFYLAEEAVNNARKHARASRITVRLGVLPEARDVALLEISDDGVGFDLSSVGSDYDRRGSLGMVNLRERTDLVNGILNIESIPGAGTTISIMIPLSMIAADRLQRGLVAA